MQGLGSKTTGANDFKGFLKNAFGPLSPRNSSIEQKLEELSEADLKTVLQLAKLVKYAAGFQTKSRPFTYKSLVAQMILNFFSSFSFSFSYFFLPRRPVALQLY